MNDVYDVGSEVSLKAGQNLQIGANKSKDDGPTFLSTVVGLRGQDGKVTVLGVIPAGRDGNSANITIPIATDAKGIAETYGVDPNVAKNINSGDKIQYKDGQVITQNGQSTGATQGYLNGKFNEDGFNTKGSSETTADNFITVDGKPIAPVKPVEPVEKPVEPAPKPVEPVAPPAPEPVKPAPAPEPVKPVVTTEDKDVKGSITTKLPASALNTIPTTSHLQQDVDGKSYSLVENTGFVEATMNGVTPDRITATAQKLIDPKNASPLQGTGSALISGTMGQGTNGMEAGVTAGVILQTNQAVKDANGVVKPAPIAASLLGGVTAGVAPDSVTQSYTDKTRSTLSDGTLVGTELLSRTNDGQSTNYGVSVKPVLQAEITNRQILKDPERKDNITGGLIAATTFDQSVVAAYAQYHNVRVTAAQQLGGNNDSSIRASLVFGDKHTDNRAQSTEAKYDKLVSDALTGGIDPKLAETVIQADRNFKTPRSIGGVEATKEEKLAFMDALEAARNVRESGVTATPEGASTVAPGAKPETGKGGAQR